MTDIEKELDAFEKMLKPLAEEESVVEASNGGPCITKDVKKLFIALPEAYVGVDIKSDIVQVLKSIPECVNA